MSVHTVIEIHTSRVQGIVKRHERRQSLGLLPPLTRSIEQLAQQALRLQRTQAVWQEIYHQPGVRGYKTCRKKLETLAKRLSPAESILSTADAAEIGQLVQEAQALMQELTGLERKAGEELDRWREERNREVESVHALLKIPDLFPTEKKQRAITELLQDIGEFLNRPIEMIAQADLKVQNERWESLANRFAEIQNQLSFEAIAQKYKFSTETVKLIQQLIAGKVLTLDQISEQSLTELSRFARFRALIKLTFAP